MPNGKTRNGNKKSALKTLTRKKSEEVEPLDLLEDELPDQLNRLTGISVLDRTLGGGLPSGSVVYIYADARSMAEVFLYQFTQSRKTFYFSNERRPSYVMRDIQNLGFKTGNTMFVDIYGEYYITPQGDMVDNIGNEFVDTKIVEFTEYNLNKLLSEEDGDINIIIDSFSFYMNLHVNPGIIKRLVNIIYETTKTLNCITYLYGIKGNDGKLENDILKSCDVVFDVELEKSADKITNKLSVPKLRGRTPTTEMIKFKVGDGVQIDTTKDIA